MAEVSRLLSYGAAGVSVFVSTPFPVLSPHDASAIVIAAIAKTFFMIKCFYG
jgi:hypothetical protein